MNSFEQLYIADLIVKAIAGSLSGEEVVELRLWRESSEENERLYQELLTMGGMELQQKEVALFVPETAWKMLSEKVSGKRKHRAGSNILKYAAVACAVSGIAFSVFYISGNKTPETVEAVAVAQVPAIAHGSSKAVLILEDGSSVKLDRQSTFQTADATVRNTEHTGVISYKKTEKTEKKEVPAVAVPEAEERNHPTVKVEMKGKEKEEAKGKNMEKPPQKRPEMDSLVVTKSYGTRQQPPIDLSLIHISEPTRH